MKVIFETLTNELKKTGSIDLPMGTLSLSRPDTKRTIRFNKIARTGRRVRGHFKRKND